MTEYATTPSAVEEAKTQRSRTADWVQRFAVPRLPPTPSTSTDSEWEKRSLWDGNGWDPPSDCESSTSVPPTMMLQYSDSRQVLITPTTHGEEGSPRRRGHSMGHDHVHTHGHGERRDEERTERARSRGSRSADHNPNPTSTSAPKSIHPTGGVPSQTSSMRLARAAAAPLPDSRSSSSAGMSGSRVRSSARARDAAEVEAINSASHIATSTNSHPSHILSSLAERVAERGPSNQPSHPSSHVPSHRPSRPPSQHPSHAPSHYPSQHPSHAPSHALSHILSQAPSHQPSQRPSHSPSHQPSHPASQNVPSHAPSQRPPQAVSHEASDAPSHHSQPSHPQPSHPPSAFGNHTATTALANPPPLITPSANGTIVANGANGVGAPSPPSIHSIHSRSISVTESRSSGPPEPIVIHPPSNPPSHSHRNASVTNRINGASVQPPPASAESASLSYYSVPPRQSHLHDQQQEQHAQQQQDGQSVTRSHRTSHSNSYQNQNGQAAHSPNGQLPTPVSPMGHASYIPPPEPTQRPGQMRTPSTMSATGLGGGYVLIDVPPPGHEKELEDELAKAKGKSSTGNKGTRERGSLFNVFGKHNRSKSLPMQGMMGGQEQEKGMHQGLSSAYHPQVYTQQNLNVHNAYLTPISPLSPTSPYSPHYPPPSTPGVTPLADPQFGAQPYQHSPPPKIVYAPARHHSATHFSPPRIMYVPASPRRGQRLAPYDTHQILHPHWDQGQGQTYAYPYGYPQPYQQRSPVRSGQKAGHAGMGVGMEHAPENTSGSVRRSQTLQETVRDSGWEEGKKERDRDISTAREGGGDHGANAGDFIARDFAQTPVAGASPPENDAATIHANGDANSGPSPVSPSGSHAPVDQAHADVAAASVMSDMTRTSQQSNMAGVGTVSARSRSRGRGAAAADPQPSPVSPSHGLEGDEIERGRSRERSRSRARGMVYSASAPQPQTHAQGSVVAPHAAMMIPPASAVRDRGVRDTPYPTPPGSVSEQLYHQRQQQMQTQNGFHPQGYGQGHTDGIVPNGPRQAHKSSLAPIRPAMYEASPSPSGLVSRFRDIYRSSHSPTSPHVAEGNFQSSSPNRGRTRERNRNKDVLRTTLHANGNGRAKSVDSQVSSSSASTYYVISTPGQKVRLIRTDGQAVTSTTSDYRASSSSRGWLKKALRPNFLRRDHVQQQQQQEHSPSSRLKPNHERDYDQHESPSTLTRAQAPALASSRSPSGGSGAGSTKSGKKGVRKLLRRNTTGTAALLSASREATQGNADEAAARLDADNRDVDIVIPGQ